MLFGTGKTSQMQHPLSPSTVQALQESILTWQRHHGRHHLPWQQDVTPYKVHVSEIMLQQTQVTTVIPYFQRWMKDFPTLEKLAGASEDEVMAHWQGLGYYSRARNLRKAAAFIVEYHNGEYPDDLQELNAIPGIGRYTAGAIRSFAFNSYGPIVDGNVKRLYARLFAQDGEPNQSAFINALWSYADVLTPPQDSRRFSQGVLDLGATLCRKSSPDCEICPIQTHCQAYKQNRVDELPRKKTRKAKPTRDGHFLWQQLADTKTPALLLEKRSSPGIWGGLWCLPELNQAPSNASLTGEFTHEFSHYRLHAKIWQTDTNELTECSPLAQQILSTDNLESTGLPAPIRQFIEDRLILKTSY